MVYHITKYTLRKAKKANVIVKASRNKKKKLDVYNKDGKRIASVGATGYSDYPTYLRERGGEYAKKRRELYHARHKRNNGVAGRYAKILLW